MKKILFFAAIITSLIAQSCSKSTDDLTTTSFNIEEAKMSFANNFNNALSTKSSDDAYYSLAGGDYTPIWEMAKANENEFIWALEVPIISDLQIVLRNKTTEVIKAAERKLLFIKNKETHSVHSFIMVSSTAETKSSNSNFEHLAENASYSGYVLYSTLAGEFVNLRSYNTGEEIANVNALDLQLTHECGSEGCSNHNVNNLIEIAMGNNEFGVMPLGMGGGEYFEGFCVGCGTPFPYCACGDLAICPLCNSFVINCKCGDDRYEYYFCNDCGTYHRNGECKYLCPKCGVALGDCRCK